MTDLTPDAYAGFADDAVEGPDIPFVDPDIPQLPPEVFGRVLAHALVANAEPDDALVPDLAAETPDASSGGGDGFDDGPTYDDAARDGDEAAAQNGAWGSATPGLDDEAYRDGGWDQPW